MDLGQDKQALKPYISASVWAEEYTPPAQAHAWIHTPPPCPGQGGHGTGNLILDFSRQGKHREFSCNTGKIFDYLFCVCYIFMYFWQSRFQIMGVCM